MNTHPLIRIGAALAVSALALPLASCSGEPSLSAECRQVNADLDQATLTVDTDLEAALQRAMDGEDTDPAAILNTVSGDIEEVRSQVTHPELRAAMDPLVDVFRDYASTVSEVDFHALAELNRLDPASEEYHVLAEDFEARYPDLQGRISDYMSGIGQSAQQIGEVCAD